MFTIHGALELKREDEESFFFFFTPVTQSSQNPDSLTLVVFPSAFTVFWPRLRSSPGLYSFTLVAFLIRLISFTSDTHFHDQLLTNTFATHKPVKNNTPPCVRGRRREDGVPIQQRAGKAQSPNPALRLLPPLKFFCFWKTSN